jgi:hypothetical protein
MAAIFYLPFRLLWWLLLVNRFEAVTQLNKQYSARHSRAEYFGTSWFIELIRPISDQRLKTIISTRFVVCDAKAYQ